MDIEPIITEQYFTVSKETLWKAITQKDQMVQWFFDNIPEFKAEIGFKTVFPVQSAERTFTHIWKVIEVIPNKKIAYTWQYKEYKGESVSIFEIFEKDNQVIVRVICEGLETFPQNIPEFSIESCQGGWNYFMNRLKEYITSSLS